MSFFIDEPKKPTLAFASFAEERDFAKAQVESQAKAYQPAPEGDNEKITEEPEPTAPSPEAAEQPHDDRHPVQKMLDVADLSDEADHAMIHDAMLDHGMDDEAEMLASGDYMGLVDSGLIQAEWAMRGGLVDPDDYFDDINAHRWDDEDDPVARYVLRTYETSNDPDQDDVEEVEMPLEIWVESTTKGGSVGFRFVTGDREGVGPVRLSREQAIEDGRRYANQFSTWPNYEIEEIQAD